MIIAVDPDTLAVTLTTFDEILSVIGDDMTDALGGILVHQVQHRITVEKRSPSGVPWRPWSEEYAKTRKPKHTLLINDGYMRDGISYVVEGREVRAGSPMIYANYQDEMRPFIGLSDDNREEIEHTVAALIEGALR